MKNILKSIGGFFVKIFKAVVQGGDPTIVQLPDNIAITPDLIDHCIKIVNIIKNVVNNPVTILVTDLTPISLDNTLRLKLAEALPAILAGLTYSKNYLNTDDKNAAVNGILDKVRLSDDPDKDALYHALAARLLVVASDGKVSWSDAVSLIELYFKQIFSAPKVVAVPVVEVPVPVAPVVEVAPVVVPASAAPVTIDMVTTAIQAAMANAAPQNSINQ